jgi:hypothetical protein
MINLIPPIGKTALKHEYVLRVASVYGFLLTGVFIASTILMVPTYVLVSAQMSGAQDVSAGVEETKAAFDTAFSEIKVANTIMAQLRREQSVVPVSAIIEEVVRVAPAGIRFSTFIITRVVGGEEQMQVQGVATNRIALASFKNTLEASPLFLTALVPIADLARDTNLPFLITITLDQGATTTPSV